MEAQDPMLARTLPYREGCDDEPVNIDDIDRKILAILIENARVSYSDLAKEVGLSRVRVKDRVVTLQNKGAIEKFTIQVPSRFLGKPLPVFFDIHVSPKHLVKASEKISEHEDIVIVYQMSGQNALHVHGFFRDIVHVSEFINDFLSGVPGLTSVRSEFLLRRYKADRSLMV